jgi:hypothetical protein
MIPKKRERKKAKSNQLPFLGGDYRFLFPLKSGNDMSQA